MSHPHQLCVDGLKRGKQGRHVCWGRNRSPHSDHVSIDWYATVFLCQRCSEHLASASEYISRKYLEADSHASQPPTGAGPLEIVRLALISPSCALATSLFGIGLPSNLFSQLQRHPHSGSSDKVDYPASTQGKIVKFAFPLSVPRRRRTVARRLLLDTLILCLAAVMLWRNWRVGTMIMVTWRCEYRWLLYCWPVACVVWWIGALGSLWGVAKKIEVLNRDGGRRRSWAALSLAGYLVRKARRVGGPAGSASQALHANVKTVTPAPAPVLGPRTAPSHGVGGVEVDTDEDELLIVRVEFPTEASCRWWNTAIQAVAVGIYLYATFVLSSVLFLTGDEAIMYAVVMTLSLSAIRIMSALI